MSVVQTGPAAQATSSADVLYATAPISFTINTASGTQTSKMNLELIFEAQTWRLLTLADVS